MRKSLMTLLAVMLAAGSFSMTALAYDGGVGDAEATEGASEASSMEPESAEAGTDMSETAAQSEMDEKQFDGKEADGTGITPEGNMTLVDDIGAEDLTGQQFITLVTKAGNTFYLIIDRDKDGNQNVHFLNMVDEADLLALMEDDEAAKYQEKEDAPEAAEPEELETSDAEETRTSETASATESGSEKKNRTMPFIMLLLFLIGAGGVGGYLFLKMKGGKNAAKTDKPDPDADYEDEIDLPEEDEEISDEAESGEEIDNEAGEDAT